MLSKKSNSEKTKNTVATSVDVARLACVSQTTVSRVFSGKNIVKQSTVDIVLEAASELGYRPNAIARSLSNRRTNIVAVVSVNSTQPFYSSIVNGISNKLTHAGKQVMFFPTDFEVGGIFQQVLQYKVDAMLIVSAAVSSEITEECSRISLPVVILTRIVKSPHVFSICSDNQRAARGVADHLVKRGYRRFAYIGSARRLSDVSFDRQKGFTERLSELGFDGVRIAYGNYTYDSGRTAARDLLNSESATSERRAIFASNDLMAMGAMDAARYEYGLSVPGDLAVVGFDAIEEGSWSSYSLTTVEQPIDMMLDTARAYLAIKLDGLDEGILDERELDAGLKLFQCGIIERATT